MSKAVKIAIGAGAVIAVSGLIWYLTKGGKAY
jgi:hypothetical protein